MDARGEGRSSADEAALVLRSSEHDDWDEPRVVEVERTLRAVGSLTRHLALARLRSGDGGELVVVLQRRAGRWRAPRRGERLVVLLWPATECVVDGGTVVPPERGAAICSVTCDSLRAQWLDWARAHDSDWIGDRRRRAAHMGEHWPSAAPPGLPLGGEAEPGLG